MNLWRKSAIGPSAKFGHRAEEPYTYLGVPERQSQEVSTIKSALNREYKRRLRWIWGSELSARNKVTATKTFAIPVLVYTFGVLHWTIKELEDLDRATRKTMNLHRSLHPKSSVQRLYLPRDEGGRGLLGVNRARLLSMEDQSPTVIGNRSIPERREKAHPSQHHMRRQKTWSHPT
ncbi:unnamed protein product [Darwinula stevensoni]|uniref:Uncharacterized protein n=1 Tax=Darwinula stevensoni TaxID=69355 RepID=A0A7R8XDE7_9CRUS|nr:unnamed protein product [Darwinula stevensoni]CAG0894667.1 unnamed protein product [Darwinula stevensoni]